MHTSKLDLEKLAQMNKSQLGELFNGNGKGMTHLEMVDNIMSQQGKSYEMAKKAKAPKKATTSKPKKRSRSSSPQPKKRSRSPSPVPVSLEDGDWEQGDCAEGKVKNPRGNCVKKCDDGKVRNTQTERCVNQKGKKVKKQAPVEENPDEVKENDGDDGDWPKDGCPDGKVKNPKGNCVKKCDDGKIRNEKGNCVIRKSKAKSGQGKEQVKKDKRLDLSGLGITKLKEIAKNLGLKGFSGYRNNPADIAELTGRIEEEQDKQYGKPEVKPIPVEDKPEEHQVQVEDEPEEQQLPPPLIIDDNEHVEEVTQLKGPRTPEGPPPPEEEEEEEEQISGKMKSLMEDSGKSKPISQDCDPVNNFGCEDGVCLIDESTKGHCKKADDPSLTSLNHMNVNGKTVYGTSQSLEKLREKMSIKDEDEKYNEEDITHVLRELSDAPDNDDVLSDPSLKQLIMCLFK